MAQRVSSEIEKEFAKYSVRLILAGCNTLIDLASAISAAQQSGSGAIDPRNFYEIQTLWKRAKNYRDRILAVYADVLSYILHDGQQTTDVQDPTLTKYGNNRLSGDIGDLSGLTVRAKKCQRL